MTRFEEPLQTGQGTASANLEPKTFADFYSILAMGNQIFEHTIRIAFFYKLEAQHPIRIRAYPDSELLEQDKSRPSYEKPRVWGYNHHGCIFDAVIGVNNSPLVLNLAPMPVFSGSKIYLLVDNLLATPIDGVVTLFFIG